MILKYKRFEQENKSKLLTDELYKITGDLYHKKIVLIQASVDVVDENKSVPQGELCIILRNIKAIGDPGSGKIGMTELTKFADENSLPICLVASSAYGSDIDRLVNFYKNFGFISVGDYKGFANGKEIGVPNNYRIFGYE